MLRLVRGGRRQLTSAFICHACRQVSSHPRRFATTRINGTQTTIPDANAAPSVDEAATVPKEPARRRRPRERRPRERRPRKRATAGAESGAANSLARGLTDIGTEAGGGPKEADAPVTEEAVTRNAAAHTPAEEPQKKKRGRKPKPSITAQTDQEDGAAESSGTPKAGNRDSDTNPSASFQEGSYEKVRASEILCGYVKSPRGPKVPSLQYGLDRALFNPGPYLLQDDRSKVYNFDPYLSRIMPAEEFDFEALKKYVTSSKDETLISMARDHKCKYTGSTSSMTSVLAHFHYLLSAWRPINTVSLSQGFDAFSHNFTLINRAPAATFLHYKDGVYAIDADKQFDNGTILSMLGKSMEKLFTVPKEKFEQYRKCNSSALTEKDRGAPEAYNYTSMGDFLMRSQLDAYHSRLPTGRHFDLKTRAVVTIRMDARDPKKGNTYELVKRHGNWQSYEREYYDMMRAAFLKYSLQVRMGRMDGIFVAFHNTKRIFGFQYIPLEEMDSAIHGTDNRVLGHAEFRISIHLLNKALDRITERFPKQTLRLYFETKSTTKVPSLYIFARPVAPGEIQAVQEAAEARVEAFERSMMGQSESSDPSEQDAPSSVDKKPRRDLDEESIEIATKVWEDMLDQVQRMIREGDQGAMGTRDVIEMALQGAGLLKTDDASEVERQINAVAETFVFDENPDTGEVAHEESTAGEEVFDPSMKMFFDQLTSARYILDEPTPHLRKLQEAIKSIIRDFGNATVDEDIAEDAEGVEDPGIPLAEEEGELDEGASEKQNPDETESNDQEVFGMVLTIQNEVCGKPVLRPDTITKFEDWTVKYHIKELSPAVARQAYKVVVRRRERIFHRSSKGDAYRNPLFGKNLRKYAKLGRLRRQAEEARARGQPIHVYGWEPLKYDEAFSPKAKPTLRKEKSRQYKESAKQAAKSTTKMKREDSTPNSTPTDWSPKWPTESSSAERPAEPTKDWGKGPTEEPAKQPKASDSPDNWWDPIPGFGSAEQNDLAEKSSAVLDPNTLKPPQNPDPPQSTTPLIRRIMGKQDKRQLSPRMNTFEKPTPRSDDPAQMNVHEQMQVLMKQMKDLQESMNRGAGAPERNEMPKAVEVVKKDEPKKEEAWFKKAEQKPRFGGWWPF